MNLRILIVFALTALAFIFMVQNVAVVEVQFLVWSARMPRSLLIFLMLAIGITIGWFLNSYIRRQKKVSVK